MTRNYARWVRYVAPPAAVALSFAVPGVLGWILRWGGVAALGGQLLAAGAGRFLPRRLREQGISGAIAVAGFSALIIIALIFVFIFKEGIWTFRHVAWEDIFLKTIWQPTSEVPKYGVIPLVTGTFLVTVLALGIAVPLGVGTAIYLAEVAGPGEREVVKPVVELLSAIPSVVYGLLGMVILGDVIPRITGTPFRLSALNGAVILAVMLTPMLASLAEDAFFSVPRSYRVASYALGATRWETIRRVVMPAAAPGTAAAVLLALARTLGETMAVLLATGNAAAFTLNPLHAVRTMTATIAIEMGEAAFGSPHYHALFALGIILFTATFFINLGAEAVMNRFARRFGR